MISLICAFIYFCIWVAKWMAAESARTNHVSFCRWIGFSLLSSTQSQRRLTFAQVLCSSLYKISYYHLFLDNMRRFLGTEIVHLNCHNIDETTLPIWWYLLPLFEFYHEFGNYWSTLTPSSVLYKVQMLCFKSWTVSTKLTLHQMCPSPLSSWGYPQVRKVYFDCKWEFP
jgi:hypothetical protein